MTRYELDNGGREVHFDGELLGSSTSKQGDSLRWLEVNVYITTGGNFIYETIGHSRVWRPSTGTNPSAVKVDADVIDIVVNGDKVIDPSHASGGSNIFDHEGRYIIIEETRTRVTVSHSAAGVVESAKVEDRDGVLFLTNTAALALARAAEKNRDIYDAFAVDRVA